MKTDPTETAALYLRSSKDRSDVSIDAQRRQLTEFAAERGLRVVTEFADAVESGKDDDRPGFQQMLRALRDPGRGWATVLALDTSRIARRRHIAIVFEEMEAKRAGVRVLYKSLPESDPITEMLLKSILQAMDEWHSLTSKAKGLAGMTENVRQGFRAGGRAPIGYRLERVETGAVRDGEAVQKSKLVPTSDLPKIGDYLRLRAAGIARTAAARQAGLSQSATTLVGVDWNALTYAGHTVWGVLNERIKGHGYAGKGRRKPRSEWVIQRDTHEAAIADAEAEAILEQLENSTRGEAVSRAKRGLSAYLLSGILKAPDGRTWEGSGRQHYRLRGQGGSRQIACDLIDQPILEQLIRDLSSDQFVTAMAAAAKSPSQSHATRRREIQKRMVEVNRKISRAMDLALKLEDDGPALRKIDELERERAALQEEQAGIDEDAAIADEAARMTPARIRDLLADFSEQLKATPADQLRPILTTLIERVELGPDSDEARIFYRISGQSAGAKRASLAFPGRAAGYPLTARRRIRLRGLPRKRRSARK